MVERTDMRGAVTIELVDRAGAVVHRQHRANRIVLTGRQLVAQMFGGGAPGPVPTGQVTEVGVGTGAVPAPDDGQTGLVAERLPRSSITAVEYQNITEGAAPTAMSRRQVSLTAVFDFDQANGDEPLREAGLFTADNVMYNRVLLDEVHKTSAFKLTVLWDVVF